MIPISKQGSPLTNLSAFAITKDLTSMAIGMLDGTILLYRGKTLMNECRETTLTTEKNAIINMFFSKEDNATHLFYSTKSSLFCYQNLNSRKQLHQPGCPVGDVNGYGKRHSFIYNTGFLYI